MPSLDAFQLTGMEGAGQGMSGDVEEMKTREEDSSSETFSKPSKRHRWLNFPLTSHIIWGQPGEPELEREDQKKEQAEGAPQAPALHRQRQTKALTED